jgi:hypothetical protein
MTKNEFIQKLTLNIINSWSAFDAPKNAVQALTKAKQAVDIIEKEDSSIFNNGFPIDLTKMNLGRINEVDCPFCLAKNVTCFMRGCELFACTNCLGGYLGIEMKSK